MLNEYSNLIEDQIEELQKEILMLNFIFSFVLSLSLITLGLFFQKIYFDPKTTSETFIKFIEAAAVLFAPYLTIIAQGFYFPLYRKLNGLGNLLFKDNLLDEEIKIIYEK
jgi:hypothetical protein